MGKDEIKLEDVEEGEISDSASIEEISEEDFNNQEVKILKETKPSKGGGDSNSNSRVWTMQDLCKYPSVFRGYTSGLYNFAWAQAVQNKPLNDIFGKEIEQPQQEDNNKRSSAASVNSKEEKGLSGNSTDRVVIDDSGDEMEEDKVVNLDKEEGELEEGEIDLDSEPVKERVLSSEDGNAGNSDELEKRVNLIRGVLEGITVTEAEKLFEGVCSRLQNALESLRGLVFEYSAPTKDTLIELAFGAVNSAFVALNGNLNEQNVSILSRLLSAVKGFNPPLFPPDKMKEIEVMRLSLNSPARAIDLEKEMVKIVNQKDPDALADNVGHDLPTTNKLPLSVGSEVYNKQNVLTETLKAGAATFRNKGLLLPLLDLHKDHDEDSLPSPTRETTPCLPAHRPLNIGDGMVKSGFMMAKGSHGVEGNKLHPYETDAIKAFSSYQQKFGRGSFFSTDRLPSPTPSEGSGDEGGDNGGEVSSSSSIGSFKPNLPASGPPVVSSPTQINSVSSTPSMQGQFTTQNATLVAASNIMSKASAKSRDPRLRFANSNVNALDLNQRPSQNATKVSPVGGLMDPRKKKSVEEPVLDGPALKRQKNELDNLGVVRGVQAMSGNGGWLEDTDNSGSQITNRNQTVEILDSNSGKMEYGVTCSGTLSGKPNMSLNKNEQVSLTGMSTPSLPALLKDIAVNPTMLLNILKMGQQQRLASETQQKSSDPRKSTLHQPSSNSILGVVAPANVIPSPSVNTVPSSSSGTLSKPAGNLQVPPPDETGKIRMKPRDPRRVLHGNVLQKSSSVGPDHLKPNGISSTLSTLGSKDNMNAQKQLENQTEAKPIESQIVSPPDIAQQFTQSLKNIAGMMSVSQPITSLPVVSQNLVSQPVQVKSDGMDTNTIVSNSEDQQIGTSATPEAGVACPSSQNTWGDVEHLFERYDDRQKAAIQRERARRLEEQNKMFAARKLSLVLDLDHTLLNSAKFVEVDPVHEEILRKKEEQDREKPQRHLFRFPKMGMWTKLRPGVWNFLEKASKLFEMHLYTMGNKLYATEMAKVLDPTGVLFAGRVISRGDDGDPFDGDERVPRSKDLEGVMGMESSVIIVDDSVRVWPHNKLNLIVVERYTYFPCSRRQFGLIGPSLLEIDHDERPEEGTLASSLGVIERIHRNFFSHQNLDDVDVRNILATEQRKILSGCRIVFSRVFPVGEANPHLHPLWQTAEQFGASCTNQIDEHVTHVVANSLGTDKVNWALSTGKFVVHPGWVEASALLYRRANEHDFAIKP